MSDDPQKDEPAFSVVDKRSRFDGVEGASPEPRLPSFVEELKARAEEAERRAREISAAYRRIDEERDAFRQRLTRDLERRVDIARAETMRRILPILDDLDRALLAARGASEAGALLSGVTIIRERLRLALASEGVEALATAGKPFDPEVAEAVATEETDDPGRDNLVVEEMEAGYSLGGTLLRPARVKVARLKGHVPGAEH